MLLRIYDYRSLLYHKLLLTIYCLHIYLGLELLLAMSASIAHFLLKIEVEMPFDEPYLSMSLQEFWGRRWNLVVSSVLRSSVYEPVRLFLMPVIGKRWGSACARVVTFMVSGLMHELIYFYWTRVEPTWEVSMFFVLHGVCTALEVLVIKKSELGEKRRVMNRAVSWVLTMGFVVGTSLLLFFPQVVRNKVDLRVIEEHIIAFQFSTNNLFGS
ncbi:hypothetical protein Scep_010342 [Stephania cephalantha]|uniref:Wax synthase domain-containing protein n=1 Tax=Stephania cephalantha TaxID=152367 RepID=A0AAP0JUV2_9MAGN